MAAKYCFFDLDGTLADTDCDIRLAWKEALRGMGLDSPDFDEKFVTGPPIDEVVKMLFPERYSPELVVEARRAFGRAYDTSGFPNTREYPGVMDAVRRIKSGGARVFIVTNKRYVGAKLVSAKFGWEKIFERLYAGDMFMSGEFDPPGASVRGKMRKPELLSLVMRELGASPSQCVMIGDTTSDFEAARKNEVASIGVSWGYGTETELAQADRIICNPEEL